MTKYFTRHQKRLLVLTRKRVFTDTVVCFLLFLLIIGFTTIMLWREYEINNLNPEEFTSFIKYILKNGDAGSDAFYWLKSFRVIVSTSSIFLLILVLTAYVNLFFIKRITLDREKISRPLRYTLYILALLLVTGFFTWFWNFMNSIFIGGESSDWTRLNLGMAPSFIAQFAFSIASTGLVYLRTLNRKERRLGYLVASKQKLSQKLSYTEEKFEAIQVKLTKAEEKLLEIEKVKTLLENASKDIDQLNVEEEEGKDFSVHRNHIKVGEAKNYRLFKYEDLLYIEVNNNNCKVYLKDGTCEKINNRPLWKYAKNLPKNKFLQISRKHIISVQHLVSRNGTYFFLEDSQGNSIELKIGGQSFEEDIQNHDFLRF